MYARAARMCYSVWRRSLGSITPAQRDALFEGWRTSVNAWLILSDCNLFRAWDVGRVPTPKPPRQRR